MIQSAELDIYCGLKRANGVRPNVGLRGCAHGERKTLAQSKGAEMDIAIKSKDGVEVFVEKSALSGRLYSPKWGRKKRLDKAGE